MNKEYTEGEAHTPTPWHVGKAICTHYRSDRPWEICVYDKGYRTVTTCFGVTQEEAEANAALIVQAVNERAGDKARIEALTKALEGAVKDLRWLAAGSSSSRGPAKTPSQIANELAALLTPRPEGVDSKEGKK